MSSLSIAAPGPSDALASAEAWVLSAIEDRVGVSGLELAAPLVEIPNGWETHTLRFQLADTPDLPAEWRRPLILRAYSSMGALTRARHEHAIHDYVQGLGYPVAPSLALLDEPSPWGGPARIMERLDGQTMLESLEANPLRLWDLPAEMAKAHAWLHQLPPEGMGLRHGDLFTTMAAVIEEHDLRGLAPGLDWLMDNEPPAPDQETVLHFDFHPLNLIHRPDGSLAVLDWADAEVGDPDADVGATCMLLECGPTERVSAWSRWAVPLARGVVLRRYLRAYEAVRPIDDMKLSYFRAWAALRRLCNYSQWLYDGPHATGTKPSAVDHLTPEYLTQLCRYFHHWSNVEVRLP